MSMVEGLSIVCLTGELPDEDWAATPRNDRPCACGGGFEHFFNASNGRLLVCHRGVDGELWGTLVTHQIFTLGERDPIGSVEDCIAGGVHEGKV
jgi:hypothetical protein